MAKKARCTFSITAEIGKKSILDVSHLLPDALPRSVRRRRRTPQEPLLLRAKTLENSLLLGSFLGRIFTIWRPEFPIFTKP